MHKKKKQQSHDAPSTSINKEDSGESNITARSNLPSQYGIKTPLAPQHHRSSEGALSYTNYLASPSRNGGRLTVHRTSCVSANFLNYNYTAISVPRLSLDTKDEHCLNSPQCKTNNKQLFFGGVWASYFFVFMAFLFSLIVIFLISYYINSFAPPSQKYTEESVEKIFGKVMRSR